MRTRAAGLVVGVAAALGALTGGLVLPDRDPPAGAGAAPTTASASRSTPSGSAPATATPSSTGGRTGPVRAADLLDVGDFRRVGITVTERPADNRLELVVCNGYRSLDDVAESGPPVQRSWAAGSVTASQQAITAGYEEDAPVVTQRVLSKLEDCQRTARGHWVYGPTHTERLGPQVTASWLGQVDGSLNTNGRAPGDEPINAGTAVLRNGLHIAVLTISWCAGEGETSPCVVAGADADTQLTALSRAAALRLGAT